MLWQKGWLETRFRLLFTLGIIVFVLCGEYSLPRPVPPPPQHVPASVLSAMNHANSSVANGILFGNGMILIAACAMLAGGGITTQPSFQATKGLHGSSLFTLSLPVSRLRLLSVRAAIGWLEVAAEIALLCCGSWFVSPYLRQTATPTEVVESIGVLLVCITALYFFSVLLATFLDDQWRVQGTVLTAGGIWWLSHHVSLPAAIDIVKAIGRDSPILAHTIPWPPMAFSLVLGAAFFCAALKVVQTREY